jgi:hypothetical protein
VKKEETKRAYRKKTRLSILGVKQQKAENDSAADIDA